MSDPTHAHSRSARLERVLAELLAQAPEVQATAVVSFDGLPMASALPTGMDEDRVAAMSAALLSLGERAAESFGRGELSQVYVEGEHGSVFLVSADDEAVLVAVGVEGAKVGLIRYEVRRAAAAVAGALRADDVAAAQAEEPVLEPVVEPVVETVAAPEPVAVAPLDAQPAEHAGARHAGNGHEPQPEPVGHAWATFSPAEPAAPKPWS